MCNYKVLHSNNHGYVVRCNGCGYLQVAFGTTCTSLTEKQFDGFKNLIADYHHMYRNEVCPNAKCIQIPTPVKALTLLYTVTELAQLQELLEQAEACMEVEKLMAWDQND